MSPLSKGQLCHCEVFFTEVPEGSREQSIGFELNSKDCFASLAMTIIN